MEEKKTENNTTTSYIIAIILFVIIGIVAWNWLGGLFDTEESSTEAKDYKLEAYVMSQDFMKDYLKSPSTAKFPSYSKVNVVQTNNRYKVEGYVDSQNSFGATVQMKYYMILERDTDGGWTKISCDIK